MKIKYIGRKKQKKDHVAGTGHIWTPGSVRDVPPDKAPLLLQYTDVWATDDAPDPEPVQEPNVAGALALLSQTAPESQTPVDDGDGKSDSQVVEHQKAGPITDTDENGEPEIVVDSLPNMTPMTKDALVTLGKTRFGIDVDKSMTKADIQEQLLHLDKAGRAIQ